MRDFGDVRQAARQAVESLRQHPVMAEDFGAQPHSSQLACLDGVGTSDVYVGIYGQRYGFVARSGLSATEEEFQEARRRGLPILCFEQKGPKEPAQQAFLDRIKAYESGYSIAFFATPEELKLLVVKAVHDLIGHPGIATLDPASAKALLDRQNWGSERQNVSGAWLGVVLVPARQGESYLDVLYFGQKDVRDRLLQPARFGPGTLFSQELGVSTREEGDALVFRQEGAHRQPSAVLKIGSDGSLVFGATLGRTSTDFASVAPSFLIDESEVEACLLALLQYANTFVGTLERGDLITSLYVGTSLTGVGSKSFGRLPTGPIQSFSIPMHQLPDPLKVPDPPLRISRADLASAEQLTSKIVGHVSKVFRGANAYYTPKSDRRGWTG